MIQFSATGCNVNEWSAEAALRVEPSGDIWSARNVDYATTHGTADDQLDHLLAAGPIAFAPGETDKLILVPLLDDRVPECTETFRVILSIHLRVIAGFRLRITE